jgi:ABC-2 type transport system ATP-binding protein
VVSVSPGASSDECAIHVSNLTKTYTFHKKLPGVFGSVRSLLRRDTEDIHAVDGVTFSIDRGEIVGFLGPNGAGKTTTLKMLCGLLYPTGGHISVLNHVPSRREPAYLRRISLVMGQKSLLWWDLPAMEMLLLHRDVYRIPEAVFRRTLDELVEVLGVEPILHIQVRKLSLGQRMKLELLTALIHRPDVLFLDEPTIGLDVVAQQGLRDFLRHLNAAHGTTILLTSHDMDDIEALCPRVLLINQGQMGYDGSLDGFVEQTAPLKSISVTFAGPVPWSEVNQVGSQYLIRPEDYSPAGDVATIHLSVPRESVSGVVGRLLSLGPVTDLTVDEQPIDDIVRTIFGAATPERGAR